MKIIKDIKKCFVEYLEVLVLFSVALVCILFMALGKPDENGRITLGGNVEITEETKDWIAEANAILKRITEEDKPTDESVEIEEGLGFYVDIPTILSRRLSIGSQKYQCSRYTAYLATGQSVYSNVHIDYGPKNGKDIAQWLVDKYGFKYIDEPVEGAIGSGGFDTLYGHTALFLYRTNGNRAMVEDANWTPLTVSQHEMDITGWRWVVPSNYEPKPDAPVTPPDAPEQPSDPVDINSYTVQAGDTLGSLSLRLGWYQGGALFGDSGYTQKLAELNGIVDRGKIYPGQVIKKY